MLRAGPLSDPSIHARLQRDFITAWVLAKDLPDISKSAKDPVTRALAAVAHEAYIYPVDSQVWSAAGQLLDHVGANDLFQEAEARYHRLLDAAVPDPAPAPAVGSPPPSPPPPK